MAIYRASIIGGYQGQLIVNVLHFQNRGGAAPELNELGVRLDAWVSTVFAQVHSVQRTFQMIDVRGVGGADSIAAQFDVQQKVGLNNNGGTNPAEAIVISVKSVFADRRRQGRFYLSGFPSTYVSQGRVTTPAGTNDLTTMMASTMALFGPNGTEQFELGTYSDPGPDKLGQVRPPIFTPAAMLRLNLITGAQRRRRIGVGS